MGIATRLCRRIESEAVRRKAPDIHLLTSVKNVHTLAIYERLGYAAKHDVVYSKDIK
jgi:ribosomal protein S18 acetylase RimI-like enzyme